MTNSKMTLRFLSQEVWTSLLRFTSPRIRVSSQRFRSTYSRDQYWEDSVRRQLLTPDPRGHNKIRCAYNTDPIQYLYDGTIRHPTPRGQNPTHAGALDVPSILKSCPNSRGRNNNVLERFNPFFQYSHLELVKLNMHDVYTPARFER